MTSTEVQRRVARYLCACGSLLALVVGVVLLFSPTTVEATKPAASLGSESASLGIQVTECRPPIGALVGMETCGGAIYAVAGGGLIAAAGVSGFLVYRAGPSFSQRAGKRSRRSPI